MPPMPWPTKATLRRGASPISTSIRWAQLADRPMKLYGSTGTLWA